MSASQLDRIEMMLRQILDIKQEQPTEAPAGSLAARMADARAARKRNAERRTK